VLRAVVLTQYRRVTDGQTDRQTDGIAIASTALAMRALRRAVEKATRYSQLRGDNQCSHPYPIETLLTNRNPNLNRNISLGFTYN